MNTVWLKDAGLMAYRVTGIFAGSYALWAALTPMAGYGLQGLGMTIDDGMIVATLLGIILYIAIVMWGFAAPRRHRPATTLLVLGVGSSLLALWMFSGTGA